MLELTEECNRQNYRSFSQYGTLRNLYAGYTMIHGQFFLSNTFRSVAERTAFLRRMDRGVTSISSSSRIN